MNGGMEEFAAAMARPTRPQIVTARRYEHIAVLGGGTDARMLAALGLATGARVTLFSAYGRELSALRQGGAVALRGAGPVGSYQIDQASVPSISTTAELDSAVAEAELIFLTGPVHKQRTYAMVLAEHLRDGQVLVLTPGRTFGALEARRMLQTGGCSSDITLVEAQGLPFWASSTGTTLNLSVAAPVSAATLPGRRPGELEGLLQILPNLTAAPSALHASFADGSALAEIPALLLGGPAVGDGAPEVPMGGVPLEENRTFRALIGAEHEAVIAALAEERVETARRFGVRDLPGAEGWIDSQAGAPRGEGARPVPDMTHAKALIRCGVIGSLVPLAASADLAGVPAPVSRGMIALASALLGADLTSAGRSLYSCGINETEFDETRRQIETLCGAAE